MKHKHRKIPRLETPPLVSAREASPLRKTLRGTFGSMPVSLLVNRANTKQREPETVNRIQQEKLSRTYQPHLEAVSEPLVQEYEAFYDETKIWHGSGRYQYDRSDREVVDVLESMCTQGTITPASDDFDITRGRMVSTSLAHSRMYARAYADIHGSGMNEQHRYGDSGFWATYMLGSMLPANIAEMKPWQKAFWEKWGARKRERTLGQLSTGPWGAKVNSGFLSAGPDTDPQHRGIFAPFFTGSDIEGNYPILFGLKELPNAAEMSTSIARHEFRTEDPIPLASVSHLEVPFDKIEATEAVLESHGVALPVVAIETGEEYCSRQSFDALVYPRSKGSTLEI